MILDYNHTLSVVITFLNEGQEVENTINSICTTADAPLDIVLVNDMSTDDFDYDNIPRKFKVRYFKNKRRMGVAASRDFGVQMAKSNNVLIIDAHMQFYKNKWSSKIIKHLKNNSRAIYCCACGILDKNRLNKKAIGFGAHLDVFGDNFYKILHPSWNYSHLFKSHDDIVNIPCILGASYAFTKDYWDLIKGLNGLQSYGCDEALLSLKVWLEGGHCKLITDIEIGHIFRERFPYTVPMIDFVYNKLFIIYTLLDEYYKNKFLEVFQRSSIDNFKDASNLINAKSEEIEAHREYYCSITTRDFKSYIDFNNYFIKNYISN